MKRFRSAVGLVLALVLPTVGGFAREYFVYFGTYTGAKSKGIYVSRFDTATGKLAAAVLAAETPSPSFLALHPNGRFLFAAGESSQVGAAKQGGVSAFATGLEGKLKLLNTQPSGGNGPCHLAVDAKGRFAFTANYGSGSVAALPIRKNGSLEAPTATMQHAGSSVNRQRQEGPHAHCVNLSPDNLFLLSCDLGLDKVMIYQLGRPAHSLIAHDPPFALVTPGSGPRHLAFDPRGKFVYVVNELSSTVTVFAYDAKRGALGEVQTISTLPKGFTGQSWCAEIAVHPSGQFVYASNRGHDSIAVFTVDRPSGRLTVLEAQPTQGRTPRHFALDPTGGWLLAENQDSDNVMVFKINPRSGALTTTGQSISVPSPVCAVFSPSR